MDTASQNRFQSTLPPRLTILLVSALALSYEILLMRLFSIVQYHHFAYMIISLALLGYGASGSFLVFFRSRLMQMYPKALIGNIILFGITAVACYLGGQHLLINPDEILWNNRLWFKLFILYLLLALPFFFAANCIALTFLQFHRRISEVYAADLIGAGLGSVFIIVLLFWVFPQNGLLLLGSLILAVSAVAWLELRLRPVRWSFVFLAVAVAPFMLPGEWKELAISPYKGLSQQMRITGSRIVEQRSSPLALLTVVENNAVPFRHAPGLSLNAEVEPPEQIGIFIDGDGLSVINRYTQDLEKESYLDMVTTSLPYHLATLKSVLVLGAGGSDILQALNSNAQEISVVELNPQITQLVRNRAEFSGNILDLKNVKLHTGEARSFIAGSAGTYDLIHLPILNPFGSSAGGLYGLNENYLYTVEAVQEYIRHLSSDGYLSISSWVRLPPRDSLKSFVTAIEALRRLGKDNPEKHLVMVRSWQTATLLIKKTAFNSDEINAIKEFCSKRLFDLAYYPGINPDEANRYNILLVPYFYNGTASLLQEDGASFIERYKFNIMPATDDRPYSANFFKWQVLPEIIRLKGQGGMALLESGYLILAITFVQAVLASLCLILLPVLTKTQGALQGSSWNRQRTAQYFLAIGLGFLFLEIAFIQKFILFLGHPLYAAAAVLAIFLVFAGLGSLFARQKQFHVIRPVSAIFVLGLLLLFFTGTVFKIFGGLAVTLKILVSAIMLGPLAFCMGMPFPLALTAVGGESEGLIPWAWAVNGCASVIAAVLATLLAVQFGFTIVVLVALFLYGVAASTYPFKSKTG
jgi:spermidine synthase